MKENKLINPIRGWLYSFFNEGVQVFVNSKTANTPACIYRLVALFSITFILSTFAADSREPILGVRDSAKIARIIAVEDPLAVSAFDTRPERVLSMVNRGITTLVNTDLVSNAWLKLVSVKDTIGIKVNSAPGATTGTRPAVVRGVILGLLSSGIAGNQIIIWDRSWKDLKEAGMVALGQSMGVVVESADRAGYDAKVFYESPIMGQLIHGDLEFGQKGEGIGKKSYVTRLLTQRITKIINITPLLNHNQLGVSGCMHTLAFGAVDNTLRFQLSTSQLCVSIPEIYALPQIADRVALHIVDALISQYQGESTSLLHYSMATSELWFSTDPVALDYLAFKELARQRQISKTPSPKYEHYLFQNAAIMELGVAEERLIRVERAYPVGYKEQAK